MINNNKFDLYTYNITLLACVNNVDIEAGQTKVFLGQIPHRNLILADFLVFEKDGNVMHSLSDDKLYLSFSHSDWVKNSDVQWSCDGRTAFEILDYGYEPFYFLENFTPNILLKRTPEFFMINEEIWEWFNIFLNLPPQQKNLTFNIKIAFKHLLDTNSYYEDASPKKVTSFFKRKTNRLLKMVCADPKNPQNDGLFKYVDKNNWAIYCDEDDLEAIKGL